MPEASRSIGRFPHLKTVLAMLVLLASLTSGLLAQEAAPVDEGRVFTNLTAFGRLYGYLRWFHPTDEAAAANWDHAALRGIQSVRHAKDDEELARMLQAFFQGCAPTLRVFTSDNPVPVPAELQMPETEASISLRMWTHRGLGTAWSQEMLLGYQSDLRSLPLARAESDPQIPWPYEPLHVHLAGSIEAWVAPTLYADSSGTYPRIEASSKPVFSSPEEPTHIDLMLADAIVMWNAIQHFYPYTESFAESWATLLERALGHILREGGAVSTKDLAEHLITPLRDGHAMYHIIEPSRPQQLLPEIAVAWIEETLVVTYCGEGPLAAGVLPGDIIEAVDGVPADAAFTEAVRGLSGSPHWIENKATWYVLRGDEGAEVRLTLAPSDSLPMRSVSLPRTVRNVFPGGETVRQVEPGILYIDLTRVDDESLWRAKEQMNAAKGIILDMRGYPNGRNWIGYFAPPGLPTMQLRTPLIALPDHGYDRFQLWISSTPIGLRIDGDPELVFLIDAKAISQAEWHLSSFARAGIATFVGGPTAGANGTMNLLYLPSGGYISWTGMIAEWSEDEPFHGIGILPDIEVHPTLAGVIEGRDEILEAGLAFLRETLGSP